jgi:prepilin-type N-terminal cleavage/methylation domain-containing protein
MRKKAFLPGFSLLEVSISLIIVGIISTIFITQFNATRKLHSSHKTMANIEIVLKSIGAYCMYKEGSLPCPSARNRNVGNQSSEMKNNCGIIPFKTLGIMERSAKDGNGQWLTYRMNFAFGSKATSGYQKNLGIAEFTPESADDKVAIVITSQNESGQDEVIIWYSERNFIANYAGNRTFKKKQTTTGLAGHFS